MSSRFVPVTDPDKAWEYRQAGLLYRQNGADGWVITDCANGFNRSMQVSMMHYHRYRYAILVEDDEE